MTSRLPLPALLLALAVALGSGCSTLSPRVEPGRQTALMKKTGTTMSALEIRQRVDALVPPTLAHIELTADRIRSAASDPAVRRRALELKIDAVPVVLRAAYQPDPLASALDLWLLVYQVEDCFEAAKGPCNFGAQQTIALESARQLRERLESDYREVVIDEQGFARMREQIREIARRTPLTDERGIARRYTMTEEVARIVGSQGGDAFSAIGDVTVTLAELSHRLNTYVGTVGDLARWQVELLVEDLAHRPQVAESVAEARGVVDDVDSMSRSLAGLEETLGPEGVAALVAEAQALIRGERAALLADVERQRSLTLEYLSRERLILLEAITAERKATLDRIHEERVATLEDLDRLGQRTLDATTDRAFRVVDHLVWRLAQLAVGLMALAALLTWLLLRTGRLGPASSRTEGAGERE